MSGTSSNQYALIMALQVTHPMALDRQVVDGDWSEWFTVGIPPYAKRNEFYLIERLKSDPDTFTVIRYDSNEIVATITREDSSNPELVDKILRGVPIPKHLSMIAVIPGGQGGQMAGFIQIHLQHPPEYMHPGSAFGVLSGNDPKAVLPTLHEGIDTKLWEGLSDGHCADLKPVIDSVQPGALLWVSWGGKNFLVCTQPIVADGFAIPRGVYMPHQFASAQTHLSVEWMLSQADTVTDIAEARGTVRSSTQG